MTMSILKKEVDVKFNERAGCWIGTSKCGGERGVYTRFLKTGLNGEGI